MNEDSGTVAVALADLRGAVNEGFAKLDGRLDVALTRTNTVEREIAELKGKVSALEAKIWKLSMAAAAVGTAGGAGVFQLMQ
ncbi:hypothetical protein [Streptomyces formicae]|uniref:Uncharacterized protein n=1 Tax=Streptomyces formicae TaxID=1616117 RepID=A0ABY3WI88_9ACTN|nr:hypothetical protein [Streptomyces formicae]UNM12314.1 hypothetical protein J4032_12915 [Streptomyces formicae]